MALPFTHGAIAVNEHPPLAVRAVADHRPAPVVIDLAGVSVDQRRDVGRNPCSPEFTTPTTLQGRGSERSTTLIQNCRWFSRLVKMEYRRIARSNFAQFRSTRRRALASCHRRPTTRLLTACAPNRCMPGRPLCGEHRLTHVPAHITKGPVRGPKLQKSLSGSIVMSASLAVDAAVMATPAHRRRRRRKRGGQLGIGACGEQSQATVVGPRRWPRKRS